MKYFVTFLILIFVPLVFGYPPCCPNSTLTTIYTCETGDITLNCSSGILLSRIYKVNAEHTIPEHFQNKIKCRDILNYTDTIYLGCDEENYELVSTSIIMIFVRDVIFFVHAISFLTSLITAYLYLWLPNLQDVHGSCIFHVSASLALLHGLFVYESTYGIWFLISNGLCIINVYLLAFALFSAYSWSIISSFNTWKQAKYFQQTNEERRLKYYKLFGYGVPIALIIIAYIQIHLKSFFDPNVYVEICSVHVNHILIGYVAVFSLITPLINFYFFFDSQRNLWNIPTINSSTRMTLFNKVKFTITLNLKLCCMTSLPLMIGAIFIVSIQFMDDSHFVWAYICLFGIPSIQGIFVFLVVVVFRKRTLKGLAQHGCLNLIRFPDHWKNMNDLETVEESDVDGQRDIDLGLRIHENDIPLDPYK